MSSNQPQNFLFATVTLIIPEHELFAALPKRQKPFRCPCSTFYHTLKKQPYIGKYVKNLALEFEAHFMDSGTDWVSLGDVCEQMASLESVTLARFVVHHNLPEGSPLTSLQEVISKLLRRENMRKVKIRWLSGTNSHCNLASAYKRLFLGCSGITELEVSGEHPSSKFGDKSLSETEVQDLVKSQNINPRELFPILRKLSFSIPPLDASAPVFWYPESPLDLSKLESLSVDFTVKGFGTFIHVVSTCRKTLRKLTLSLRGMLASQPLSSSSIEVGPTSTFIPHSYISTS